MGEIAILCEAAQPTAGESAAFIIGVGIASIIALLAASWRMGRR